MLASRFAAESLLKRDSCVPFTLSEVDVREAVARLARAYVALAD